MNVSTLIEKEEEREACLVSALSPRAGRSKEERQHLHSPFRSDVRYTRGRTRGAVRERRGGYTGVPQRAQSAPTDRVATVFTAQSSLETISTPSYRHTHLAHTPKTFSRCDHWLLFIWFAITSIMVRASVQKSTLTGDIYC